MTRPMELGLDRRLEDWLPPVGDANFRIWWSSLVPDLGVIWARDHDHTYPAHIHDCVELIWIHSGRADFTCRGVCYPLKAGDLCLMAPNELHHTQAPPGERCTVSLIHVPSNLYWPVVDELTRQKRRIDLAPVHVVRAEAMGFPLLLMLESLIQSTAYDKVSGWLMRLLEAILVTPHGYTAARLEGTYWHPAVRQAREAIAEHADAPINVQDIARQVGLNVRYFISLFKEGTGLSPHQYQIAMRVDRARNLIQDQQVPLSEVAVCAGFSDQSHLNRHFKRSYGYTPGGFRQIISHI